MKLIACMMSVLIVSAAPVRTEGADEPRATIIIRGARSERVTRLFVQAIQRIPGMTFDEQDLTVGEQPQYLTDPFEVDMTKENYVGQIAQAVAESLSNTDLQATVNVVLFTEDPITEESVSRMRDALRNVNGVDVDANGGLGGVPKKGYYWVQLEAAGGAELKDILQAARRAGFKVTDRKQPADG